MQVVDDRYRIIGKIVTLNMVTMACCFATKCRYVNTNDLGLANFLKIPIM